MLPLREDRSQDTKLFETILGLTAPWHLAHVELKTEAKRVDLWLEHEPTRWPCPDCGTELAGFDHAEARTWTYRQGAAVSRFFKQWYGWAVRSRGAPVKQVAATLKRHLDGVLRFVNHPITNRVAEGLNGKIMSIKRKAGGFRNASNFTTAIDFHCGGLDLYPR